MDSGQDAERARESVLAPDKGQNGSSTVQEEIRAQHYSLRTDRRIGTRSDLRALPRQAQSRGDGRGRGDIVLELACYGARRRGGDAGSGALALLFLYKHVLGVALPWLDELIRARTRCGCPRCSPRSEVRRLQRRHTPSTRGDHGGPAL